MSKQVATSAKEVNQAHQFAKEHAETAVEWAIKCGQLLGVKKKELGHGPFAAWVNQWCDFSYRSGRAYMQAAAKAKQNGSALPFSSVRQALETDKPAAKPSLTGAKADAWAGVEPVPAAPAPIATKPDLSLVSSTKEPERPDDSDEDAHIAAAEAELAASIDKVMASDDRLAAAYAEIKRLTAELAVVKLSRDGYMNGKEAVTKLLKAAQRQIARLEKNQKAA
jgi:hypothetical protein